MKWIAISGSWRQTSAQVEHDVREAVDKIISEGNGVITGGALNVDYFALDEVLRLEHPELVRVYLPSSLSLFSAHYRKRANEGIISMSQAESLILQLSALRRLNPNSIIENINNTAVNEETYLERNSQMIRDANELIAFQVNKSGGTQDAIDKAKVKGIPIELHSYSI